jgi:hypothetical protein
MSQRHGEAKRFDSLHETDFRVQDEGTIFLLQPLTDAARRWSVEHLPDDAQRFGSAYFVEH